MLWTKLVLVVTLAIASADEERDFQYYLTDEFIAFINRNQTLWKAGRNFDKNIPHSYLKRLAGTLPNDTPLLPEMTDFFDVPPVFSNIVLPKEFDARYHWPMCPTISEITDQGSCGSCWAVAPAAVMTDRICIRSNGNDNFYFSGYDILTCCPRCSLQKCQGGAMPKAWAYCRDSGVVSGGPYNSSAGCKPYKIPPCYNSVTEFDNCHHATIVECSKTCDTKNYEKSYFADRRKCRSIYKLRYDSAMKDIFKNGPVTAHFKVYEDFYHYQSGIYINVGGLSTGLHSVKLLGWGVENGVKYWLAANSWSSMWGEKGYFKILRGENHCGIEDGIWAGRMSAKDVESYYYYDASR